MEKDISQTRFVVGLRAAIKILNHWSTDQKQHLSILDIPEQFYASVQSQDNIHHYDLTEEQKIRISYVLNIHAKLRTLFMNKDNIYGFMSMANNNAYFEGQTPLDKISFGNFNDLKTTYNHIQGMVI